MIRGGAQESLGYLRFNYPQWEFLAQESTVRLAKCPVMVVHAG